MTVQVFIGRRIPKAWFKRQAARIGGLLSFQENIWQMIKQSMALGKRKCNQSGKGNWVQTKELESEDLHYNIEWMKIFITGTEAFEKEEYEDALKLYDPFNKVFKKEFKPDVNMKKHFKTKVLSATKVDEAYKKGYGSMADNNVANKLLEMGVLTSVEWIEDYKQRNEDIKPDF